MRLNRIFFLMAGLVSLSPVQAEDLSYPFDAVLLGDSISTGGGTHPALKFDTDNLWEVFNGRISAAPDIAHYSPENQALFSGGSLPAPRRLWPTMREFFGGPDWVYRHLLATLSQKYLDTEEYSWGYLTAKQLGMNPARLAMAAEDGARMASMPRQIDRILQAGSGRLPANIFVFYTGNDLCGLDPSLMTTAADYAQHLERGLMYLARAHAGSGDMSVLNVWVLSFMSMGQLLDSRDILDKKIFAFGRETTCAALRKAGYRPETPGLATKVPPDAWYFAMAMPPNPAAFCPTVFMPDRFAGHSVSTLANRIRDYREAEAKVVAAFHKLSEKNPAGPHSRIRLRHLKATAGLQFSAEEVGEDCFHLSLRGQEKVAKAVADEIRSVSQ
jgi:lysophospholipase L1-like esterase